MGDHPAQIAHRLYHVLSDISFALPDGSLGIIGDNGAGKSTLLKLLVGTLQPSSGKVQLNGQVAALLELGAGFHPEFTGRRNIYLNASLGVPNDNIAERKRTSSNFPSWIALLTLSLFVGTKRLAFSIATMVRPDILVIDEALSVGDMAFQRKCVERMNRFRAEQKTMVFCSHSMFHIQELCDTAIWIDKGKIRKWATATKWSATTRTSVTTKNPTTPSAMTCLKRWNRPSRRRAARPRTAGSIHSR